MPDSFVALGSPIGCFSCVSFEDSLTSRLAKLREAKVDIFNLFHPNDPVSRQSSCQFKHSNTDVIALTLTRAFCAGRVPAGASPGG